MTKIEVRNSATGRWEKLEFQEGKLLKANGKQVTEDDINPYDTDYKPQEAPPINATRARWFNFLMTCSFVEFDRTESQIRGVLNVCKTVYDQRQFWNKRARELAGGEANNPDSELVEIKGAGGYVDDNNDVKNDE